MEKLAKKILTSPIIIPVLTFFVFVCLLPWNGYYIINDSYVYHWNALHFFDRGLAFHPLTGATSILQTVIAAPLYHFFPYFGLGRGITLFFSFFTILGFYKVLKQSEAKNYFFPLILLVICPLFIYTSFSFMTDIYFLTTLMWAIYFYLKSTKNPTFTNLSFLSLFLILSFLSRQNILVVLIGMVIFHLYKFPKEKKLLIALIPVLLVFVWYQFIYTPPLAYTYYSVSKSLTNILSVSSLSIGIDRGLKSIYYLGFFTFPFSTAYFLTFLKKEKIIKSILLKKVFFFSLIFLTSYSAYLWFVEKEIMFYLPNIISYAGFNPSALNDGIKQTIFVNSPFRVKILITILSLFSASIYFQYIWDLRKKTINNYPTLLLFVLSFIHFAFLLLFRDFYDRYLLYLLPAFLIPLGLYKFNNRGSKFIGNISALSLFLIVFAFEHDYLNLNKKIWEVAGGKSSYARELNPNNTHATYEFSHYFHLDNALDTTYPEDLFDRKWLRDKIDNKYLLSYTDTWVYCRAERVFYPSFISSYSRTEGYFHIMVKKEEIDGSSCPDQVKEFNIEVYGQ